jgi:hypothetical protein
MQLWGVACPTESTCVAVGENSTEGVVVVMTNGLPGPAQVVPSARVLYGVACPTATTCLAVGHDASGANGVVVPVTDGIPRAGESVSPGLLGIACPGPATCLAVGQSAVGVGVVLPITNGSAGGEDAVTGTERLDGVACSSVTTCEAVGGTVGNGGVVVPLTGGVAGPAQVVAYTTELRAIACPGTTTCQAVGNLSGYDNIGVIVPITAGTPGARREVTGTEGLSGVACATATNCQAVGSQRGNGGLGGTVVPLTDSTAGPPVAVRDAWLVSAVACPTATACEGAAADRFGEGAVVAIDATGTIPAAGFTFPVDRQTGVDTFQPFTWSTTPQAQGYHVMVGTTAGGADLVDSGPLPASQASFSVPALPSGPTLYATLLVEVAGVWSRHQTIGFTARPGAATFTYPQDGQTDVDTSQPFRWATIPQSVGNVVTIGTKPFGTDLFQEKEWTSDTSLEFTDLPAGVTLYATLYSGGYQGAPLHHQAITFTAARPPAYPLNGQGNVDTTKPFTWPAVAGAQGYAVTVGTSPLGLDLVNSGMLSPSRSRVAVPDLPLGRTLYLTVYALVNSRWTYQAITFTAAPGKAAFTYPTAGQTIVDPTRAFTWSTITASSGYIVTVGTTRFGHDLANSAYLPATESSFNPPKLPRGLTLYATVLTRVNGAWTRFQDVTFTVEAVPAHFTYPADGQAKVVTPMEFAWAAVDSGQNYCVVVGTTRYGADLVNSGVLPAAQTTVPIPALPSGRTLYATLFTKIGGTWLFHASTFTTT